MPAPRKRSALLGAFLVTSLAACVVSFDEYDTSPGGAGPSGPGGPRTTCVTADVAPDRPRQVDVIFVIDNSLSMAPVIQAVEQQLNAFTSIVDASKLDYRVIMLSHHGVHDGKDAVQGICVSTPLGGASCTPTPPPKPAETAHFFHHNEDISGTNAVCQILGTFSLRDRDGSHEKGWSALLRVGARKAFVVISDDRVNAQCNGLTFDDRGDSAQAGETAAQSFESALFAMSPQFGNLTRRNYVWHSIVGLAPLESAAKQPHPSSSPIVTKTCTPGATAPATGYQALSRLTGGLRFPTCGLDYTPVFQAIANDAVERATIGCEYPLPQNPAGKTIDPAGGLVRYTSGSNVTDFEQVRSSADCAAKKFFVEGDRIKLCAEACSNVQADPAANVKLIFSCL